MRPWAPSPAQRRKKSRRVGGRREGEREEEREEEKEEEEGFEGAAFQILDGGWLRLRGHNHCERRAEGLETFSLVLESQMSDTIKLRTAQNLSLFC
jgi:hypothetical protein